jgi:hypothetical protein
MLDKCSNCLDIPPIHLITVKNHNRGRAQRYSQRETGLKSDSARRSRCVHTERERAETTLTTHHIDEIYKCAKKRGVRGVIAVPSSVLKLPNDVTCRDIWWFECDCK